MAKKLISFDDTKPGLGLPEVVEERLNEKFSTKGDIPIGMVTSTVVGRIIPLPEGSDLPALEDGDLIVWYSPPGESYFDDFSAATVGAAPDGWTERWASSGTWVVQDDPTAQGGKVLRTPGTSGRNLITLNAVDTDTERANVDVLFRAKSSGQLVAYAFLRASGEASSESAIRLGFQMPSASTGYYKNGTWVPRSGPAVAINEGGWNLIRSNVDGETMRLKVWPDDAPEPSEWTSSVPIGDEFAAGWVGIGTASPLPLSIDWVAIATGGRTATKP